MWFEILLVVILFKFQKRPNISGIRVVCLHALIFYFRFCNPVHISVYMCILNKAATMSLELTVTFDLLTSQECQEFFKQYLVKSVSFTDQFIRCK